jgi:TonB family protein
MFQLNIKLIYLALLFAIGLSSTIAQSTTPQSKEAKEAAKIEEKQRKEQEKEAAKQAEIDRKENQKETERLAKYELERPINRTLSYDRFKDLTTYNMNKMLVFGNNDTTPVIYGIANISLTGGYYVKGQTWQKPEQVILQFEVLEAFWEYRDQNNRNLIFLVDGERLNLGILGQEEFNVRYIGNLEKLFVSLPYEVFAKIANAKTVETQLGRLEFKLDPRHLEGLRYLIKPLPIETSDTPLVENLINFATYVVNPIYPKEAKKLKLVGVVKIEVIIDSLGNVISVTGISGEKLLIESAIEAVKQWKFKPDAATGKAKTDKFRGVLSFNFSL